MGISSLFMIFCFLWNFFFMATHELQSSQTQVLVQLRKQLEYPKELDIWNDHRADFCSLNSSTNQVNLTCQDDTVIGLRIVGNRLGKTGTSFNGFSIPNHTLSQTFSIDSFITTLTRLNNLRILSLVSLGIWGPLPDKIHRLSSSLEYLDLSSNYLFGSIPPKISTMVKLHTLNLEVNFFNDTMPDWLNSLSNLTVLSLNNNSFSGKISNQFGRLIHVQHLDISFNSLQGIVPRELFSLSNITYLNLASNKLNGSLPDHLNCGEKLEFVDISNNMFMGKLPSCLSRGLEKRVVQADGNCFRIDTISHDQHEKSYCGEASTPRDRKQSKGKNIGSVMMIIFGIFVLVVLMAFAFIILLKKYYTREISEQHLLQKAVQDSSAPGFTSEVCLTNATSNLGTHGFPLCQSFTLEEIKEATSNFSNSTFLGESSFGKLYKGRLENGTQVVIRCLPLSKKYSIRNLKLRLDMLGKLRHPHLVCLLGHCIDVISGQDEDFNESKVFLVSEYVSNGSFRGHLSENGLKMILNWSERLAILIGIAKAVHFLHTGVIPGFHNNRLKTNNILLNEHKIAKLSDYGLSLVSDEPVKSQANVDGLKSWQMMNLSDDLYSFGFILLEAIVSPSFFTRNEAFVLKEMASLNSKDGQRRIIDPKVQATCSQDSLSVVITVMTRCISPDSSRPSIEDVLWNLQYAAQVQESANGDERSNSASHH